MKLLATCQVCGKRKLFVARRAFQTARLGIITSKKELCRRCARRWRKGISTL